jgi:hypothetical protein
MTRERLLATTLLELAESTADEFDVLDFLQRLVDRSTELVGAAAAGLVLADQRGAPHLVTSSSHERSVLRLLQVGVERGPWVDAFRRGEPVVNIAAEEADRRWPEYAALAGELGLPTAHVLPVRMSTEVMGALGVVLADERALTPDDLAVTRAMAGIAVIGLLQERTPRQKELLAEQLQTALSQQVMIEQAKGVLAERMGIGMDRAFELVAAHARVTHRGLSEVASGVLAGIVSVTDLVDTATG